MFAIGLSAALLLTAEVWSLLRNRQEMEELNGVLHKDLKHYREVMLEKAKQEAKEAEAAELQRLLDEAKRTWHMQEERPMTPRAYFLKHTRDSGSDAMQPNEEKVYAALCQREPKDSKKER